MHPAPIKTTADALPADAMYCVTLKSGERIYRDRRGRIYAVASN